MTWREWMQKYLTDSGLWPEEALAVVNEYVDGNAAMQPIADRGHDGYPPQMNAVVALGLHATAVRWIDANKPQHWARPMFLPPDERDTPLATAD